MKAVALTHYLPISNPESLLDVELPDPKPQGRDLLVRVHAVSVNPVDVKVRSPKDKTESPPRVLGWDASGVVEAVGPDVKLFKRGDAVYYAGSILRPGCDSELHLVDERIVGHKPKSLDDAQAAALPLTALTAHEALFDRCAIDPGGQNASRSLLIINGAGGVGSIAIQFAKLAGLRVIATASRPESQEWCREMGADHVISHREDIPKQLKDVGHPEVDYLFNTVDTVAYWNVMCDVIKPRGRMVSIVEAGQPVDLGRLMGKSVSFSWELMFTRSRFQTQDMEEQHRILNQVGQWMDSGRLKTTLTEKLSPISAANLRAAHARLESGKMMGKLVLEGWR
ncbi:zinc-binding alcohol dehydrogenase family protein [Archangium violaceum]|uniref:zinc-binding alcohol dehydrogenase family protein n=1 Tax=Archangium violaceum TaxID=83451 RepID=UPI00194F23B8|nr:zinc-binding alcohol dehydrogenase family protein [Archangium violaceum]QRO00240.1 zinc-binding alcohol dehydrogenase family protein [Archangium violaceum]